MRRGDEVTASDMDALLAELQDAGGIVNAAGSGEPLPSYSRTQARGSAGSTSVLREQHNAATRNTGVLSLRRSSGGSGGGHGVSRGSLSTLAGTPSAASSTNNSGGGGGFSSYTPNGLTDLELRSERHTAAPLNIRLAPIATPSGKKAPPTASSPSKTGSDLASPNTLRTPKPPARPKAPSGDRRASLASTGSNGSSIAGTARPLGYALAPLPSLGDLPPPSSAPLSGTNAGAHPSAPPLLPRDFDFRKNYRQFLAQADAADEAMRQQAAREFGTATPAGVGPSGGNGEWDEEYREANFLPIMCARYLNPAGLTPAARWGHSLTAMGGASSASRLYMFGGMELQGGESNRLVQFDTSSIAWEPTLVLPSSPSRNALSAGFGVAGNISNAPAPRYNHAACAYEDRYLIISGGAAKNGSVVYGDLHMFDTVTHQWRLLWQAARAHRNEPAPRFGHTMVVRDDRLYIFGGKVVKGGAASASASGLLSGATNGANEKVTTTVASADIYVFSLNSLRWKKRIHVSSGNSKKPRTSDADKAQPEQEADAPTATPTAPAPRAYHAATVKGNVMYINGGADAKGFVLGDTWQIDLSNTTGPEGGWKCLHSGQSADAIPRERHDLFACGEALLVVGGCSSSMYSSSISGKFNNFVSVLLAVGADAGACWIPVAMGNVSIVAPNKKNFAAAFMGGFVYVFGGMCGMEPATNTMIRFLAADGYVAADARATALANDEAIRGQMRELRERPAMPHDVVVVADITSRSTAGNADGIPGGSMDTGLFSDGTVTREVKLHKVILAQRAPMLWTALQACRSDTATVPLSASAAAMRTRRRSSQDGGLGGSTPGKKTSVGGGGENKEAETGDTVDAFLQDHQRVGEQTQKTSGGPGGSGVSGQIVTFYTTGNSRVRGLTHALSAEELSCLADYLYWGGLPSAFKRLLRDEIGEAEDDNGDTGEAAAETEGQGTSTTPTKGTGETVAASRQHLKDVLATLKQAADDYQLKPLGAIIDALLAGSRRQLHKAQERSTAVLRKDMKALLEGSSSGASCTVLFVDPHTHQQSAHALHPAILMESSSFFLELMRPIYTGEKTSFQVASVAAKITAVKDNAGVASTVSASPSGPVLLFSGGATSLSKRAVLVGPVAVPKLAVPTILNYLYTQKLEVAREFALDVMIGAQQLGLPLLQSYCEAIVAREEVNYDTCCSFYFLAKRYNGALLEETSLLTAVSGYAEVRHSEGYRNLSDEDRKSIDAVAAELGSSAWVPPPQPTNEIKSSDVYAARWNAASLS